MTATCKIERKTGRTIDESTGAYIDTYTTVYEGKCKVQTFESYEQSPEAGGHTYTLMRLHLHVPISATGIQVDDRATITASASDSDLVGAVFRIAGDFAKDHATARRFPVERIAA